MRALTKLKHEGNVTAAKKIKYVNGNLKDDFRLTANTKTPFKLLYSQNPFPIIKLNIMAKETMTSQ